MACADSTRTLPRGGIRMRHLAWLAFGVAALAVLPADAEPLAPGDVPAPLAPWIGWVLRGHEAERCPFLDGGEQHACAWPARLELELDDRSGRFAQSWELH